MGLVSGSYTTPVLSVGPDTLRDHSRQVLTSNTGKLFCIFLFDRRVTIH